MRSQPTNSELFPAPGADKVNVSFGNSTTGTSVIAINTTTQA